MELQSDYFEVWAQKYNRQESIAEKKSIFKDYCTHYDPQACDFIQLVQTIALEKALKNFVELDDNVKRMVIIRARALKSFGIELLTVPADTFAYFLEYCIPAYEMVIPVTLQGSQTCNYGPIGYPIMRNNILLQAPQNLDVEALQVQVSNARAKQEIFKHNAVAVVSILSRYMSRKLFYVEDMLEEPSMCKSSVEIHYIPHDEEGLKKVYELHLNDFLKIDAETQQILETIATCHSQGLFVPNQRYCVTEKDREKLCAIKEVINNNKLFKMLQINIDSPQRTHMHKIKDVMLFAFPLFLASHVMPQLIYNYTSGKLLWCMGGLATYGAGFVVGDRVFPCFDYFHSSAFEWRKWFGKDNYTPIKHQWSFAILGLIHYIALSIADKCLQITYFNIGNVLGYGLHLWRLFIACKGTFSENYRYEKYYNIWYLQKYDDVVSRRNRYDKSATLGDLVNNKKDALFI